MTDFTSSSRDFAADVRRLSDPHADHAHKIPIATALRDAVDSYTTSDINAFMSILLQPLIQLVKLGQPVFVKDSPEQQLRHMYLEILLRMPGTHEQVRTSAAELMSTAIQIIRVDNEENAVLAIKICVDVFRIHKAELQAHGQTFIDTILEIYKNMDGLVSETFGGGPSGSTASPVASASSPPKSSDGSGSSLLPPAMHSFRVMAECPIATIIFGQINFQLIDPILHFLQVEAEPQKRAREEASSRGEPLLGVSPTIKNKAGYTAFVTAQVKSMSLLAYIIRAPSPGGPPDNIKQNQELLPQLSIRLLQDIPMEAPGVRKEMGVAVRHIVATDFRDKFFPYLDQLLDDRLLVGVGITGREQLRPFAYTALADLVHFRRTDLTPAQLLRVIHVFSCHLHDSTLSPGLQNMSTKHLVDRLDLLGDQEARSANITLRLFKMVFMSVNLLPEANETVLAPHLTRLIMDSFPLASKAREPMSYYLLIRALFRSISGGKFDRVYNEILPLLQELLENLNRLIAHAEGNIRDLLVELCLTVPVRLTHLLPFLQHLMRPLVLALKGSPEMAAQGLRTLELCIDNLTQDFLEPCFAPVRRDLMGALYDLLRPLPANHLLSHACIRILGKLGGRNRRLQYNHPVLDYHPAAEEAAILLSFDSRAEHINLAPMTTLAAKSIRNSNPTYRKAAFDVLKHATSVFLQDGAQGRERESVFTTAIDGLFNAIHIADLKEQSIQYIRDLSKHIFMAELLNREPGPASSRRYPMSPLATTFVEWLPKSLAWIDKDELKTAEGVVRSLIEDLAAIGKEDVPMDGGSTPREPSGILHNLASAFVGMCHNESWRKKMAGCKGITIMVSTDSLPPKMTLEREFDFVRALISMLKDMPVDPPRDVDEVTDALMDVIKKSDTAPAGEDGVPLHRARMPFLTGILHMELASANAIVRSATQQCITLLSELSGKKALALADAEDQNLLGRPVHRQNSLALNKLRVACIKLLTASMRATDFFAKQPTVRQKAIQVYFKSLYSQSLDVKNAAHDGLRIVLQHQTRLPKELLQAGLRPILMNLADPKRISVSGLDGLARLLELLTHYFKVEIGVKLLEHYNSIAEPSMLHEAAFSPISTNEEIAKLVKLINIFHLLPAAANMYLENLSNLVVETESHLHAAAPTPFTEVYGQYVDRYADEAVKYFIAKLDSPRHVQTMRNVLIAGIAPNFRDELMVTIPQLLKSQAPDISVPLLLICRDLVNSVPSWLERYPDVLQVLLDAWRNALQGSTEDNGQSIDVMDSKVPSIILSIFTTYLRHSMKVDLLFEVVAVYTVRIPIDLSTFTHFLYQNVIAVESVALKHEVLASFLEQFGSSDVSWAHKTQLLVMVINPMLQAALARKEFNVGLLDGEVVAKIHSQIWHPMAGGGGNPQPGDIFPDADDWLKIQLLQMSSAVIQFAPQLVVDFKKDLIKCGWNFISTDDMFVRQAAYVTTARFFEAFESPVKFVLRLWQSLLRPLKETERNVEDRHLTRVALNILTPVLNKRVPSDMWIRQTRVVLHEEGHTLSALLHIYQVVACLEICRANVGYLGDQRGALLKDIVQLVEKSPSTSLCKYLMEVVREWIIERREAMYPNLKEKASLIQRMTSFMRDDGLLNDLLGMVFDIYNEPTLRRSELTIRLEPIYLLGCRAKDPVLRTKFVDMFDESLPKSLSSRLQFVLGSSSWEHLGDQYWIPQALDLLLSSADGHLPLLPDFKQQHQPSTGFSQTVAKSKIEDLLRPVRTLLQLNSQCTHQLWISVFKSIWATLSRKEQLDVTRSMIALLSKDYHFRQVDTKVNVIQSFLAGIHACSPPMSLPPYLVKYLGKTYNAWHVALEILQASLESYREEETSRDGTYDALAEIYSELSEDDMFYGLWRRRSLFNDTNVALSFEQAGMFSVAQAQYEVAQIKSRNGHIPFNEAEYCVWEDHWVLTAQKLQQWDILFDLARAEENPDLLLESAWRHLDWNTDKETIERALNAVADVATPRRRVFEAYTALVRSHGAGNGDRTEFIRLCDEAMQLSLRKWAALPAIVSMSHIPLLQHFQQFVELHEASAIFTALQSTTGATLERKSAELKGVLQAWRERLPNLWDDITIWSDLVSWRQHVFNAINNTYLPLIPQVPQPNPNVPVNTTFGFRGHHETAWIINRFAHVARKHQLPDVCHTSLARIYTLPNIEISEAFLKLREQARCHYQNAAELHAGLEVINNTNLMYFSNAQKAEFYTLKGMFIAKLGHNEEANTAFGQAVQTELNLPKAWAEWGRYNDRLFKETPADMSLAANAVSCYLQAAGLYKSAKTRPLIIRVLWLLSNDDQQATVARAFDNYKGDLALWYWITVIPQLLVALTYKETPHARNMLINLAKTYPQALFFHLRTLREDMIPLRRKHMAAMAAQADSSKAGESSGANGQQTSPTQATSEGNGGRPGVPNQPGRGPRYAWESVDEIVAILKTAFPLLALTMETMVDQFAQRFKATQEEELVRYFNALLMEALQCHSLSVTNQGVEEPPLPMQCLDNVTRFADSALNPETRALFKADVIDPKPNLREYIRKLQVWRDKYEKVLEARPRLQPLDVLSHWLVEFQHSKFDEVEVPGQYLEHKDTNSHFVKIARFASQYELCLGMGFSYRRITILGHDGTKHSFIVQLPTSRTSRREEKLHQLFRIFNSVLVRRKETRKRVLSFYLPAAIPLNPQLRLLENDSSVVGLQDIYDQHLRELGLNKEDPVILHAEKFRAILDLQHKGNPNKQEYMNLRMELFDVVSAKMVPNNILSTYMSRSMADANNLWLLRKQFTTQMAAVTFQSYIMCCVTRTPSRYHISRSTGQIYMSDFTPGYRPNVAPLALGTNEAVPFRFTPNFQAFVGPIGVEGIMTSGIMAIGRTLSEPEYDLEHQLGLFIRDDLIAWHALNNKQINGEPALKPMVAGIVDQICKKAELLSCRVEREGAASAPTNQAYSTTSVQSVVSLISTATNPQLLSRMAEQWLPWL
ncbi:hypothetical protein FRC01_000141 [Tulasnella sp. 417]|nr:hypothetical protein FRC01_000141 [Tulasnella sp. 417]